MDEKKIEEKYPHGILSAFLALDPDTMSEKEMIERFVEIRSDATRILFGSLG